MFLVLLAIGPHSAAALAPESGYVFPPGGKAGTTVEVRLGGYDWTPDMQFFVLDRASSSKSSARPATCHVRRRRTGSGPQQAWRPLPLPREAPASFALPADLPPGPSAGRPPTPTGRRATGVFIVGTGPEVVEDEARKGPQMLAALPVTVSGRLLEERGGRSLPLHGRPKAGPVTCELTARRLGSNFHGVLEVRDAAGRLVARGGGHRGARPGPDLRGQGRGWSTTVSRPRHRLAGDRSFVYRLALTPGPRVAGDAPRRGQARRNARRRVRRRRRRHRRGQARIGRADPSRSRRTARARSRTAWRRLRGRAAASPLPLSDLPETGRLDGRGPRRRCSPFPAPSPACSIRPAAEHRYRCDGKKGDRWRIVAEARRFGSPLDVALASPRPRRQGAGPQRRPARHDRRRPGIHRARRRHLSARRQRPGRQERLARRRLSPGSRAGRSTTSRCTVGRAAPERRRSGQMAALTVKATRTGGFKGPIAADRRRVARRRRRAGQPRHPGRQGRAGHRAGSRRQRAAAAALVTVTGSGTARASR